MAWATCNDCGSKVHWSAKRGTRLADLRCRCGGTLRAWRRPGHDPKRSVAMSIRTPEKYRHDPNLRAAFRDGARGASFERRFRPMEELEAAWAAWPEADRARWRSEEVERREAFRAGEAARQRVLEARGQGQDKPTDNLETEAALERSGAASLEQSWLDAAEERSAAAEPEAARGHLVPESVSATRDGNRLTVATADWTRVYRFPSPMAAEAVKDMFLANAAENRDWIRWWFDLSVEQCGGRLLEESPARPAAPVTAVHQGGENEASREEKTKSARREVNGMAKLQVRNMHFFNNEQQGNLRAVCSLQVGDWLINGVRVMDGKNGPFVSLPGRQDKDGNYHDIAHPLTKEGRESLNKVVLDHYQQGLSQQKEQAQEQVAER